jgi:hypothetical protein
VQVLYPSWWREGLAKRKGVAARRGQGEDYAPISQ